MITDNWYSEYTYYSCRYKSQSLQLSWSSAVCVFLPSSWNLTSNIRKIPANIYIASCTNFFQQLHIKKITSSPEVKLEGDQTRISLSLPPVYSSCNKHIHLVKHSICFGHKICKCNIPWRYKENVTIKTDQKLNHRLFRQKGTKYNYVRI